MPIAGHLKKNKKITPENIPAATQLFTPHWIVRYLVAKERPLQLIHLAVGDAWTVEDALIRGLRRKDVRKLVAQRKALSSIFQSENSAPMDQDKAMALAKECLLIRADQWREMAEINLVDLEEGLPTMK